MTICSYCTYPLTVWIGRHLSDLQVRGAARFQHRAVFFIEFSASPELIESSGSLAAFYSEMFRCSARQIAHGLFARLFSKKR